MIYTDLHHLKLNLLPRFLFKIIELKYKCKLVTIGNRPTAVSLTRLLYFNFKIAFVLNNRCSAQNTSTTTYPGTIFHNYYFITWKNSTIELQISITFVYGTIPILLVSKHIGLICGNEACSVYLMPSKHLLKHDSTMAIKISQSFT